MVFGAAAVLADRRTQWEVRSLIAFPDARPSSSRSGCRVWRVAGVPSVRLAHYHGDVMVALRSASKLRSDERQPSSVASAAGGCGRVGARDRGSPETLASVMSQASMAVG